MSDPRYTDPDRDAQFSDPVLRRNQSVDRMWGWIAGIAVVVLIGFILIAGWNSNPTTASNPGASPPSTTGMGSPTPPRASPMAPTAPSPAAPSPSPAAPSPSAPPSGTR